MNISKKIKNPISQELKIFEKQFFNSVSSNVKLLDLILRYILKRKGKQIRPILVILFSKMYSNGEVPSKTYRAANLVELIHSASLIHDDVVDDSKIRRSFLTINALWKNKISVLVGDFFLSKALLLSTVNKDYDLFLSGGVGISRYYLSTTSNNSNTNSFTSVINGVSNSGRLFKTNGVGSIHLSLKYDDGLFPFGLISLGYNFNILTSDWKINSNNSMEGPNFGNGNMVIRVLSNF